MEQNATKPATSQDSGFVIEDRSEGQPHYLDMASTQPGSQSWTPERKANTVLRFARKSDGERFLQKFMPHAIGQATVVPL